ncbi:MAG: tyrosinase family protein [Brucellaceae bacterium]|nr:tyrosinase family protein [Brucellaceae bacterium]
MADKEVKNPTYIENIRHFFDEIDHIHMWAKNIDLSTYKGLFDQGPNVYFQTLPPNANMPKDPARKWSQQRSDTYKNWIAQGYPFGTAKPAPLVPDKAPRIRKDIDNLSSQEIADLTKAFRGIMALDPSDSDSYFALAGLHWYPAPTLCQHHVDKYNPWHRAYLLRFEDALRKVEGCENVTLPYWDITKPPADFLFKAPFSSYKLPRDIHPAYPAGYETSRFTRSRIVKNVAAEDIADKIDHAMIQTTWGDFSSYTSDGIEAAHDHGHGAVGETLSTPDAAAFDPIFWFFHSNWDRLWWEWQKRLQATTYWTFRSTIQGSTVFLEPPFDDLRPFAQTSSQTIDSIALGVGYELQQSGAESLVAMQNRTVGSLAAGEVMAIHDDSLTSIRLKGIDRTKIPGSFRAELKADGKKVAHRIFFQSTQPQTCENCRKNALINLDFRVPLKAIRNKRLDVEIHTLVTQEGLGSRFPLHSCGNPTLNARLLLEGG